MFVLVKLLVLTPPKTTCLKLLSACVVSRSPALDEYRLYLFITTLICSALGSLYCIGRYVNEMLHYPHKFPRTISAVLELHSRANFPWLVNLALHLRTFFSQVLSFTRKILESDCLEKHCRSLLNCARWFLFHLWNHLISRGLKCCLHVLSGEQTSSKGQ